jgi:hypothetical protein
LENLGASSKSKGPMQLFRLEQSGRKEIEVDRFPMGQAER